MNLIDVLIVFSVSPRQVMDIPNALYSGLGLGSIIAFALYRRVPLTDLLAWFKRMIPKVFRDPAETPDLSTTASYSPRALHRQLLELFFSGAPTVGPGPTLIIGSTVSHLHISWRPSGICKVSPSEISF